MNKDKRNNIQLLGTLYNADESGIIANANQICDDVQQKDQETINSELIEAVGTGGSVDSRIASAVATETSRAQEAEANRYTKNETYTKEEVNNLITTPNQKYVSVTATEQTTVVTDVLPATGAANTIYRVGNWDGSQYDTTCYTEYAWSGSIYVLLNTKEYGIDNEPIAGSSNLVRSGGVQEELALGAVYDVSAKNPTAGSNNDGKWESLSALLSDANLSILIPTPVRKGGMSIKFVQSSDNKYVQYLYKVASTTVADFTNVNNWEKTNLENELRQLKGIFANRFIFSATTGTYVSKFVDYHFVNGHSYLVHIEYPEGVDVVTYTSIRNNSDETALQNGIGMGSATRDIHFTCNVDNGEQWYLTVVPAHDTDFSFNATIIDLDVVSLAAIKAHLDLDYVTKSKMSDPILYALNEQIQKTTNFASGLSYPWYIILKDIIKVGDKIEWSVETESSDAYWIATRTGGGGAIEHTDIFNGGNHSGVFKVTQAAEQFALSVRQFSSYTGDYNIKVRLTRLIDADGIMDDAIISRNVNINILPNIFISPKVTPNVNTQYGYISFGSIEALYITTVKGKIVITGDSYKTDGEYRAYFKDGTDNTRSSIIFIYIDTVNKNFVSRGQDRVFNDTQSRYILLGSVVCVYTPDGSYTPNSFVRASFPFEYTVNGFSVTESKIADNAVTTAKLGNNSVSSAKADFMVMPNVIICQHFTPNINTQYGYISFGTKTALHIATTKGRLAIDGDSYKTDGEYRAYFKDGTTNTASSVIFIYIDTIEKKFVPRGQDRVFNDTQSRFILLGAVICAYTSDGSYTPNSFTRASFPFEYTVNGSKDIDSMRSYTPYGTDILTLNPSNEILPILKDFNYRIRNASFVAQAKQLVLLQLTDQHGDETRMNRAMQFASKYGEYIDDVIHTGDLVYDNWTNGLNWFANVQNKNTILQVIGNHDVMLKAGSDGKVYTNPNDLSQYIETSGGVSLDKTTHPVLGYKNSNNEMVWVNYTDIYGRYIAPYVSNWGVVQPSNAATQGLNYYYKDYTEQGIRLVILDCMMYDTAQNTWLVNVLADAKANGYGVIIAEHYPIQLDGFEYCAFTSSGVNDVLDFYQGDGSASTLANAQLAVDNFMNAGGEFICWLAGHTHKDCCGTLKNYPKQVMIVSNITGLNHLLWGEEIRTEGTKTEDCFSVIAVDRYKKIVRLYRVGNQWDRYGRHKVSMAFDYRAAKMVYSS